MLCGWTSSLELLLSRWEELPPQTSCPFSLDPEWTCIEQSCPANPWTWSLEEHQLTSRYTRNKCLLLHVGKCLCLLYSNSWLIHLLSRPSLINPQSTFPTWSPTSPLHISYSPSKVDYSLGPQPALLSHIRVFIWFKSHYQHHSISAYQNPTHLMCYLPRKLFLILTVEMWTTLDWLNPISSPPALLTCLTSRPDLP